MSNILTNEQREQIKRIFWNYAPEKVWLFEDIPKNYLSNAKIKYAKLMHEHEEIIMLFASSSSGEKGFILSTDAIYTNLVTGRQNTKRSKKIALSDIKSMRVDKKVNVLSRDGMFKAFSRDGMLKTLSGEILSDKLIIQLHSLEEIEILGIMKLSEEEIFDLLMAVWNMLSSEKQIETTETKGLKSETLNTKVNSNCKGCGATIKPNQRFCEYCGSKT